MTALTETELLRLWESAAGQKGAARALTLAAGASADAPEVLLDATIGERDAMLLSLHERCFGSVVPCELECPSCGERLETELTIDTLRVVTTGPRVTHVDIDGAAATVRPLTSRDVLAVDAFDPEARRMVLSSCIVDSGLRAADLAPRVIDAVEEALSELDPQADIEVALDCPSCDARWASPFDIASFLWLEFDAYVRRLLADVRSLALAYGWTESECLEVSPLRRRFYLEAVTS